MSIRAHRPALPPFLLSRPTSSHPQFRRWVVRHRILAIASCAGFVAVGTHLVHTGATATIVNPVVTTPRTSTATLAFGPLPSSLVPHGTANWTGDISVLDAGIRADIAADRQEGFRTGAVQQFAAGARLIRLVLRDYATPSGAEAAYARQARYVRATLPDPSLRTSIAAVAVNGDPAVLATYTSGAGTKSYTVTTLLFRRATLVGQVNAFPAGVSDGQPARDSRDLQAIARGLISPPAS